MRLGTPAKDIGVGMTMENVIETPAGTSGPDSSPPSAAAHAKHVAMVFGQIVGLLMIHPHYKHYTLADLEWLVAPAVSNGLVGLAEAQVRPGEPPRAVGAVLWARVSEEVDARLTAPAEERWRMKPHEWTDGDVLWIIESFGEANVVRQTLVHMQDDVWKSKPVKMRVRADDGGVRVLELSDWLKEN
jgi:hemolysin-activating ACP:hemolysin acyltransferase